MHCGIDLLDVFRGTLLPSRVLRLLSQLPDYCNYAAELRWSAPDRPVRSEPGPWDFRGWGMDRQLLAAIYDAVNQNTRATGQWNKRPPKIAPFPRPQRRSVERAQLSLAEMAERMKNDPNLPT